MSRLYQAPLRSPPGPNNELFAFELLKPKEGSDSGGTIEWTRIGADEVTGAFPAPRLPKSVLGRFMTLT